ncbi:MAG TPA: hypothetical protein VLH81_09990 [Desulfobacterales bacterium]|nr:hypothetical protein [Desulfobacterales bacterium]
MRVTVAYAPAPDDVVERTLRDGLESRITFTVRLYERRAGLAALFGDALLDEINVSRVAFYDTLAGRFVVEQDGEPAAYADGPSFADGFFNLHGLTLDGGTRAGGEDAAARARTRYVAARAQYDPVRLSPPLTILTLFGVAARATTPWARRDVPVAPAADALP